MGDEQVYCVYMMTNPSQSTLYIGMTGDLAARTLSHQQKIVEGFTKKYNCIKLVYYEVALSSDAALMREKELKGWNRLKKVALLESMNPTWKDLSADIGLQGPS